MFGHLRHSGHDKFFNMAVDDDASDAGFSAAPSVALTAPVSDVAALVLSSTVLSSHAQRDCVNAFAPARSFHDSGHADSAQGCHSSPQRAQLLQRKCQG